MRIRDAPYDGIKLNKSEPLSRLLPRWDVTGSLYYTQGGLEIKNEEFLKLCKKIVAAYFNKNADKTDKKEITEDDVYIVWSCKVLQNNKALVSTNVSDGMYYEITHNGDKGETYVDAYKKWENFVIL